jgi:hypothetical protein
MHQRPDRDHREHLHPYPAEMAHLLYIGIAKKVYMNKILIALLAGIALGMLMAPDRGSVTRGKLIDGFNGLADDLSDLKDKYLPGEDKRVYEKAFGDKMMSSYV